MEQTGNQGASNEMILHDVVRAPFIDVGVPGSLGINHDVGPVATLTQTSAESDPNAVTLKAPLDKRSLQRVKGFFRTLLAAGGTGAKKKMVAAHQRLLPNRFSYITSLRGSKGSPGCFRFRGTGGCSNPSDRFRGRAL